MTKMIRRPLLPPVTPPLQHGLQRGGIFDAAWTPPGYVDQARRTVPTNSPAAMVVPQSIFQAPVSFQANMSPRRITGMSGPAIERTGMRPMPVAPYHQPGVPDGSEKGGIFGTRTVVGYPMMDPRDVPKVRTTGYGRSPDGIGGCGSCGGMGCGCGGR